MPIVSTPGFYPERLEAAVKARGLTWTALADAADIRTSTLSDYKLGRVIPSPEQLEKIADALAFPAGFFMRPVPVEAQLVGPRLFRASASLTMRVADQAESSLGWIAECVHFAEEWLQLPNPEFLDEYRKIGEPLDLQDNDIEAIALAVRSKLGFGRAPISRLVRTLEKNGIPILRYTALGERKIKLDGLSQHTSSGRPLCALFAREEPCLSREYFSLAHELGHIVLHSQVDENRFKSPADEKILEGQANRFASAFLLPAEEFRADLYAPTLRVFEFLKKKWKASIAAMVRRCLDLGIIDRAKYSSLNVQISRKRWKTREPLDDVFEVEEPLLIRRIFETLKTREGVSIERIQSEVPLSPRDMSMISGLPAKFFEPESSDPNIFEFPSVN